MLRQSLCCCHFRRPAIRLCIFSLFILLCAMVGLLLISGTEQSIFLLMRAAAKRRVSIVGSVLAAFSFLVSSYLIIYSKPWLAYSISGILLLLYTAGLWAVKMAFGTAGWLISLLLLFPLQQYSLILLWLSIRKVLGKCDCRHFKYLICASAMIGIINYIYISPFLAEMIESYETMGRYAIHVGLDRCI